MSRRRTLSIHRCILHLIVIRSSSVMPLVEKIYLWSTSLRIVELVILLLRIWVIAIVKVLCLVRFFLPTWWPLIKLVEVRTKSTRSRSIIILVSKHIRKLAFQFRCLRAVILNQTLIIILV